MHKLSLNDIIACLAKERISSRELTQHYIKRIDAHKESKCVYFVDEENALIAADGADQLLKTGQGKPLTGIPMAHKDIFCTNSIPTTCGSKMLQIFILPIRQRSLID